MKKLLIMLMVVAMAAFLFVGCIAPPTYTLTMAVNPTGGGTTTPAVGAHPGQTDGTVVNITATPATGYKFVNWTGDVAGLNSASTTVTMNAAKTVTANFELIPVVVVTYDLTMQVSPTGSGTTTPAVGAHPGYADGTVVNITATPASGYKFVKWTGDVAASDSASTTVTMNADKTVTANFEELTTHVPVIMSVPDAEDKYVNKAEAADGIIVHGTGPTYSEIKLYIDGIFAGTGDVTETGAWTVVVAKSDLGADGEKILYATATIEKTRWTESAHSNEIKFTLDTALPTIKKCSAKAGILEVLADVEEVSGTDTCDLFCGWDVHNETLLVSGIWKIEIMGIEDTNLNVSCDSGDHFRIEVTDPSGNVTPYGPIVYTGGRETYTTWIPGVELEFPANWIPTWWGGFCVDSALELWHVGCEVRVKVTAPDDAAPGHIDVTFDEAVTGTSILAGTWTAFGATEDLVPTVAVRSATVARLTETLFPGPGWGPQPLTPRLVPGVAFSVSCSGIIDLAGNPIPATAPETCTGVVLP